MGSRSPGPATNPLVIDDQKAFEALISRAIQAGQAALDTEAASFHRYYDRIYLLQISTPDETAVIDPLTLSDPGPLGKLLADSNVELVFHDADYDLRVLQRDYQFRARRLFDTRIAAQLLGEPGVGLGSLLEKYFGIHLDKRMQRADWSRRPLTDEMIAYAAGDTAHLLDLRNRLESNLEKAERLHWAQEEFERLEDITWSQQNHDGNGFLKLKGAKGLKPREMAVLRSLHDWRERRAAEADRAAFRILGNDTLMRLSSKPPRSRKELLNTRGVTESVERRFGAEIMKAIGSALELPPSKYPKVEKQKRPKPDSATDARFERLKSLRNRRAKALNLEPGVICPNGTLFAMARTVPQSREELTQITELRRWQIESMGEAELFRAIGAERA